MSRTRKLVFSVAVAAVAIVPVMATPALATHRCGLGDSIVNAICESHPDELPVLCKYLGDGC